MAQSLQLVPSLSLAYEFLPWKVQSYRIRVPLMSLLIACPSCSRKLRTPDNMAGRKVKCPSCGGVSRVAVREIAPVLAAATPTLAMAAASEPTQLVVRRPAREEAPPVKLKTPSGLFFDPESIIREVASRHHADSILKKIAKIEPKQLANARAGFASEMSEDERPLYLFDNSFWQNGKAGLLLTDRRLYSSFARAPIAYEEIYTTTFEKPKNGKQAEKNNLAKPALLVNGAAIYTGPACVPFWIDVLPQLGKACRKALGGTDADLAVKSPSSGDSTWPFLDLGDKAPISPAECEQIAAAAVCDGQTNWDIVQALIDTGMNQEEAKKLTAGMLRTSDGLRRPIQAFYQLATGLLLCLSSMMGFLFSSGRQESKLAAEIIGFATEQMPLTTFLTILKVVMAAGMLVLLLGLYRLIRGNPPLKVEQLLTAWRRRPAERAPRPAQSA